MQRYTAALALANILLSVHAAEATDMGPAAFLWPPDRTWGAAQDNTPPCGSSAGVTNRTEFPLSKQATSSTKLQYFVTKQHLANGEVSLVLQDESYNVNLAISYQNSKYSHQKSTKFRTKQKGN